jgi:hypothetical protein
MSWILALLKNIPYNEVDAGCEQYYGDLERHQTVKYGSLEMTATEKKRRGSDASRAMSPNRVHKEKINSFASSSSLLGLLQEIRDKDEWNIVPATGAEKNKIKQPRKNSASILPFYSKVPKSTSALHTPMQGEYIETIKTQFFNLGISTGASLQ